MVIAPHYIMFATVYPHAFGMETLGSQQPENRATILERTNQDVANLRSMASNTHVVEIVNSH